jgi:response regulator NasT
MSLRILLIDPDSGHVARLLPTLRAADCDVVVSLQHVDGIDAHLRRSQPDLVIVFSDAPDSALLEQLGRLMQTQPLPIVVFVEESDSDTTAAAIRAGISAYVVAGWESTRLRPILDAARERFRQFENLRGELTATRTQLAERKCIERAKGILMRVRGLSEDQAYQALRRQAMDRNQRLADIAESVIAASELLG